MDLIDSCPENLQGADGFFFVTLLNALLAAKCNITIKDEYSDNYGPKLKNGDEFDFIVIGSGSAGSVVANKLSENSNWKVLVLEAGDYPSSTSEIPALLFSLEETKEDWQYKTEKAETSCLGFKNQQCNWPRGKVLGGTSVFNAMLYVKGNKKDYDNWAELGNSGWDWNTVKEYFKQIENLHGLENSKQYGRNGYLDLTKYDTAHPIKYAVKKAYELLGYPSLEEQNPESPLGILDAITNIKDGRRMNAAKAFLGKVKNRSNLFVSLKSFVEQIIIDSKTNTAKEVVVRLEGDLIKLKATKEIIVSGGSINSPQILMLSGIGPKEHLDSMGINVIKDLPVGEHLEDHIFFNGFEVTLSSNAMLNNNPIDQIYEYFMHRTGMFATVDLTSTISFINTKNVSKYPNFGYHHLLYPADDQYLVRIYSSVSGINDQILRERLTATKTSPGLILLPSLLNPESKGKILLRNKNPEDPPLIQSGYFTDENGDDVNTMLEGIRFLEKLIELEPIKKFNPKLIKFTLPECDKFEYKSDEYWKCAIKYLSTTIYHPSGTCRMGTKDDGTSVVDSRLRVHGVKNLRVADASIMPKIVTANTQATAMMIGYKAGVMITEDWTKERNEL